MKSVKLALIFIGFVLIFVVAFGWKHFINVSKGDYTPEAAAVISADEPATAAAEVYAGAEQPGGSGDAEDYTVTKEGNNYIIKTNEKIEIVDSRDNGERGKVSKKGAADGYAAHRSARETLEQELVDLLNSGRYKESEKLCMAEWCLNSYYVDVKTIGRLLSSRDDRIQKSLRQDGILDSQGRLTEKYRVKSVGGIERLKSIVERY